jgi:hypothetical protein
MEPSDKKDMDPISIDTSLGQFVIDIVELEVVGD